MNRRFSLSTVFAFSSIVLLAQPSLAQRRVQDRIRGNIETTSTVVVRGNVHPLTAVRHDRGVVSDSFRLEHVTMMFKSSPEQEQELEALLARQRDPASPDFHRWLSPEEFSQRFGLTSNDVGSVASWLQAQGFTIDGAGRGGRSITFSGAAGRFKAAFQMPIHTFEINGGSYYANVTDPAVPSAIADVVLGFKSLNNFKLRPRAKVRTIDKLSPDFTSSTSGNHFVVPNDFATIYNLAPLYAAGLDGRGQTIAVVGQTDIQISDIHTFRSVSGLPANDPVVILAAGSSDPGTNVNDLTEADLDIEWAGAIAPNAQIIYVNSFDVMYSLQYAVDQHVASIVSITYGDCENHYDPLEVRGLVSIAQQASAQGMTIVAAAGDSGAADCDLGIAKEGLAVDLPASLPFVTAVGGTEFQDTASSWSNTNNGSNGSALAYIPEGAWNDSAVEGVPAAGGGGPSFLFSKPDWQVAAGVPNDNSRDVPDISFDASPDHDGYLFCSNGSCVNGFRSGTGTLFVAGGTSVVSPAFAGIVALINEKLGSAQGNVNPTLYKLASTAPSAFHDITIGGNQVPCTMGTTDCPNGGSIGYAATAGYDLATGLGSVDIFNLVSSWPTPVISSTQVPQPIADVEQGSLRTGYMVITADAGSALPTPTVSYGVISSAIVQSQAGLSPSVPTTDGTLFVDVFSGIGRNLGVAIANAGDVSNTATLTLRDANGNVVAPPLALTLAPHQQLARFITELFPSVGDAQFTGSLRIQGTTTFAALGLLFSAGHFSTVPVITATGVNSATTMVLPQFAIGQGWDTEVGLVNGGSTTISGRIDILDTSGNPQSVTLNGVTQSSFTYSLPPGSAFVLAPRDPNGLAPF
jgi:subtilase family serine protease